MFIEYAPNVKATISFLKRLGVKVNNATVNETLQNHPDWPSLLCINDSLNKWNIPNGAGKTDPEKIDELPTPFIAYTNDRENPLAIVTKLTDITVEGYQKNYQKSFVEKKEDFIKKWNGVYLIAEPKEQSGEHNYEATKRKSLFDSLIPFAAFILLIALSLLFLNRTLNAVQDAISLSVTGIYLQYFILLTGVVVTSLLLWYEIDKSNPLLQKVCTGIAKGNCNAILTGKQSKLFSWLSWSEVGFFYFTGSLLTLLFAGNKIAGLITLISCVNVIALPYVIFSIYYQWRVAKQWCVLCLAVQALLVLGGINVITNSFLFQLAPSFLPIAYCILFYLSPILTWFAIKPDILKLQEAKNTKREYLRIKFNTEIFDTLLKKQRMITVPTDGLGIDLGNSDASNTLIKVCNPYCGPCSKAHPKIEELLEENANVKAKIIFTTPNDEAHHAIKPTRHLMAIAEGSKNEKIIKQSLDDWYLAENKDYELFAKKYPMNGELERQGDKIEAMNNWCKAMEVHATPTIFLNGYALPDAYSIEDLKYFLAE